MIVQPERFDFYNYLNAIPDGEWFLLWLDNRDIFLDAEGDEAATGHTFRTPGRDAAPPAAVRPERPTRMTLVYIWILLFGFVGTQLAWTLRPFFGDPDAPFALFREISGTFYGDILSTIGALFG